MIPPILPKAEAPAPASALREHDCTLAHYVRQRLISRRRLAAWVNWNWCHNRFPAMTRYPWKP